MLEEYYGVNPSSDFFTHYGIPGMKWGVRRYQNSDGTLTSKAKKVIVKGNYGYLNPTRKDKKKGKAKEREKVSESFANEYWKKAKDLGVEELPHGNIDKAIWDKYKNSYAKATLKDMHLPINRKSVNSVKRLYKEIDPDYTYGNLSEKSEKKARVKRDEYKHPIKTKVKKSIKQLSTGINTASSIKNLIRK